MDTTEHFPEPQGDAFIPPGARIGRYVVRRTLGRGGMGVVLLADDERLGRKVAIKLLRYRERGTADDAIARARLVREAQSLALLSHPNVVTVHDVGTVLDRVFIAMEYVEGTTLREWLRAGKRPLAEILRVFVAAGRGLAAAHAKGLVHRDFKPDNVILGKSLGGDPRVLVVDFGLARAPDGAAQVSADDLDTESSATDNAIVPLTMSGYVMGTPLYMAPEQHMGVAVPESDQFAFCVALYEALFDARPFSGESMEALGQQKHAGKVREFPATPAVPRALRNVLRRGLAVDPKQRFARMDDLVDALDVDPARTTRRLAMSVGVVGTFAVLATALPGATADRDACAQSSIAAIWDADRRREVEQTLGDASAAYGGEAATAVITALDDYADRLDAARRSACEATDDREQTMACLDRRHQSLAAMIDVLAAADASVAEKSIDAVARLPDIAACASGDEALPDDPALRARIVDAQGHASRVAALTFAGRYADAKSEAELLLVEAGTIGHAPLLAEAEYLHAEVLQRLAEHEAATAAYLRATELAQADDPTAARAWIGLVFTTGHSLAKYELADEYVGHADAAVQRIGSPVELASELLSHRGAIAHDQGDYGEAQAFFGRALALREAAGVPPGSTLVNLGRTQAALGQIAVARETVLGAIGQLETRYGGTHPIVAKTLTYLGSIEFDAGEYATAKSHYERALSIQELALGPKHPETAFSLNNIANTFMAERDLDQAVVYYERAREILRERLGADHPDIGRLTFNMAELQKQLKHWDRAKDEYRAAIATFERAFGAEHPDVGRALNNLASVQFDIGEYDESLRNYTESLRVVEKALGADHPGLAYPLVGIGQIHIETQRPDLAIPPLERALALRGADDVDPVDRGDAQLALARALWDADRDRARARELATAAIASFDRAQPGYPTAREQAVAWLASRD